MSRQISGCASGAKKTLILLLISSFALVGCLPKAPAVNQNTNQTTNTNQSEQYCLKKDSSASLSLTEAKQIAIASECGDRLKDTYICNDYTGTWWFDLELEKEGCAPACVVNVETKEAEINWRCTGLVE